MTDLTSYIASQLNDEQTKAALHIDTSSLIIAGAGSGKTRTLIYKIAYLIWGKQVKPTNILAVTFTNKASNEMRERLLKIAEEFKQAGVTATQQAKHAASTTPSDSDSIDDFLQSIQSGGSSFAQGSTNNAFALQNTALKWIGTFHSTLLKMLKEDIEKLGLRYTKDFGMYDPDETKKVISEVLKKLNMSEVFKVPEVKNFISNQKNNGNDPKGCIKTLKTDYDQSMYQVYEEYQKILEKSNSLDFDDLLLFPYLLFKHNPEVLAKRQRKFPYILVDEAQDTNWIQFELIKQLSGNGSNVTLIGDDFQSIYGWRGAIMENFLNVKKYRPDMQMFKLQTNYRSRAHIVQAGNEIIKNNPNQYQKEIVPHRKGSEDKIICFSHANEMSEAANVVDFIKKMKDSGKLEGRGKVAILYRTNAQSSPFEQVLLQAGIPYKIWGAFKFFERKEVKDIISYIKYLLNPNDSISLKRVVNTPERSVGKTSLEKLDEEASVRDVSLYDICVEVAEGRFPLTGKAKSGITNFIQITQNARLLLDEHTPSQYISHLVKAINYRDYLVKEEGGESQADEKYENIGQLINMAEKYVDTGVETLRQFMEEVTLLSDISENEQGTLDAIKLMTVHASKGLEFPLVFIVGLEDSVFPLANSLMEPKLLEEERRLMYVAITRAQDHVFISYAHSRLTRGQTKMNPPSRFIAELPADLVKKYDLGGAAAQEEVVDDINEGDTVSHKLFGTGYVLEVRNKLAIVKFQNPKFGVRKIELKFLKVV